MREIKFRAWDNECKVIREYDELKGLTLDALDASDFKLEQFTGLTDMNGEEIYEGDIIKFFGANKKIKAKNEFGIIVYKADRYGACFNSIIQNKEHGYGGINIAQDIVIGNVHTNPELLEEKK
ncbi:YopX family protein [Latilactobacillus sakei]|uniref:YopX family protein n=1 Tax=Latilactobacillus sakei TaxID=1599 RepID=UPI0020C80789|nr:YopX family protein [Latilactobacillus sakei]MCP8855948.1 YopX family protein [Latilactobacillus sakei]